MMSSQPDWSVIGPPPLAWFAPPPLAPPQEDTKPSMPIWRPAVVVLAPAVGCARAASTGLPASVVNPPLGGGPGTGGSATMRVLLPGSPSPPLVWLLEILAPGLPLGPPQPVAAPLGPHSVMSPSTVISM